MNHWVSVIILIGLVATAGISAEDEKRTPPPVRAGDWVDAWVKAKEACPEATSFSMMLVNRSGPKQNFQKLFNCVDIKAAGELLVISVKATEQVDDSVLIVKASDVIQIEITKARAQ